MLKFVLWEKVRSYTWVLCAIALAIGLSIFARSKTHHFSIDRIVSPLSHHPEWEIENPPEVEEILAQPFHFFTNGGQSWSFLSDDGKWIIKFFDFRPTWHDLANFLHLPDAFSPKLTPKQIRRREGPPQGYAIAARNLRRECGLVGVFLNGKDTGISRIQITNPIHCQQLLDLGSTSFVIQKRAETLPMRLARFLKSKETDRASQALSQALNLIAARSAAGIADGDNTQLHHNLGFVEDEAIYIDAGTFVERPELAVQENAQAEILRSADLLIAKLAEENFCQ